MVGQRELDAAERRAARPLERSLARMWLRPVVLALVLTVICTTLIVVTGHLGGAAAPLAVILGLALDRRLREAAQFHMQLRRDLAANFVRICRGPVADLTPVVSVPRLRLRSFENREAAIELEVLPESQLVWTIDGKPVDDVLYVATSTTAPVPPQAMAAANFVKEVEEGASVLAHQRALTPEELHELDGYAPAVHPVMIVLAVVAIGGAIATFALALSGRLTTLLPPFVFGVIGWIAGRRVVRKLLARKRIARDLAAGYVVIVRVRTESGEMTAPEEVLPHSGIRWTEDGAPSPWRRTR